MSEERYDLSPCIDERANNPLSFGKEQRLFELCQSLLRIPKTVPCRCLQDEDLDDVAPPSRRTGAMQGFPGHPDGLAEMRLCYQNMEAFDQEELVFFREDEAIDHILPDECRLGGLQIRHCLLGNRKPGRPFGIPTGRRGTTRAGLCEARRGGIRRAGC